MSSEPETALAASRSPLLMNSTDTLVLVVDVQEKLWPAVDGNHNMLPRIRFLLESAAVLGVPVLATEQYPKGLGRTIGDLSELAGRPVEKMAFSAGIEPAVLAALDRPDLRKIVVVGIEAHVCVLQTAMDLLASGYHVYAAVDAVGSRRPTDKEVALQRMAAAGVALTTVESAVFEWTAVAGTDVFRRISKLVKALPLD
jgi:nicotinamidase-related amidase